MTAERKAYFYMNAIRFTYRYFTIRENFSATARH